MGIVDIGHCISPISSKRKASPEFPNCPIYRVSLA
jgi:hypothetical protein